MEALDLKVSMSLVTSVTETYIKLFHKIMREKGYKLETYYASATVEYTYEKENLNTISIGGWNGKTNWQAPKMLLSVSKVIKDENGYAIDIIDEHVFQQPQYGKLKFISGIPDHPTGTKISQKHFLNIEQFEKYQEDLKACEAYIRAL